MPTYYIQVALCSRATANLHKRNQC